jgi:hypothetical protein
MRYVAGSCVVSACNGLRKPPSGFARRKGGWLFILGCSSAMLPIGANFGTGPLGTCEGASCGWRGEATEDKSRAKGERVRAADWGLYPEFMVAWIGGNCGALGRVANSVSFHQFCLSLLTWWGVVVGWRTGHKALPRRTSPRTGSLRRITHKVAACRLLLRARRRRWRKIHG